MTHEIRRNCHEYSDWVTFTGSMRCDFYIDQLGGVQALLDPHLHDGGSVQESTIQYVHSPFSFKFFL